MAEYLIQDTTLDAIADAINAKTGGSSAMTPAQMVTEIGNISGGEETFFTPRGALYKQNMEIPVSEQPIGSCYSKAANLVSARVYGNAFTQTMSVQEMFSHCPALKTLVVENLYNIGHDFASYTPLLENVTFGKIGIPVKTISQIAFRVTSREPRIAQLTITIYVADDATLPLANSPWSATNATIIYRSATTGEVIPV